MGDALVNLVQSMLDDDYGVSLRTYEYLLNLRDSLDPRNPTRDELNELLARVRATNSRFYLPEGEHA